MKMTLSTRHAAEILAGDENANWSRAGAFALVEYLESLEEDTGEEIELDRVAIRCDWTEYASLEDWASEYFASHVDAVSALGLHIGDDCKISETSDEIDDAIREYAEARGTLIEFDGGVIVSAF